MTLDAKILEKILEARDRQIDRYETLLIGLGSKSPDAILSNILGVESVQGLTVEFGAAKPSGRMEVIASNGEGVVRHGVTAAFAPDAEDCEKVNSHLFARLYELEGTLERSRARVAELEKELAGK